MIFFFILITCLLDVVLIFEGRLAHKIFPFLSSSYPIKLKTSNNQNLMTGIFQYLILLCFTLSSHWLPVIFSFVLIGHYHNSNKTFEKKIKINTEIVHVPISSCLLVVHSLTMSSGVTPSTTLNLLVNNLNQQWLFNKERANYHISAKFFGRFLAQVMAS